MSSFYAGGSKVISSRSTELKLTAGIVDCATEDDILPISLFYNSLFDAFLTLLIPNF